MEPIKSISSLSKTNVQNKEWFIRKVEENVHMDIERIEQNIKRRNQLILSLTKNHPQLLEESQSLSVIPELTADHSTALQPDMDLEFSLLRKIDQLMDKARSAAPPPKTFYKKGPSSPPVSSPIPKHDQKVTTQLSTQHHSHSHPPPEQPSIPPLPPSSPHGKDRFKENIKKLQQQKQTTALSPVRQSAKEEQTVQADLKNESLQYSMSVTSMAPFQLRVESDELLEQLYRQEQKVLKELQEIDRRLKEL